MSLRASSEESDADIFDFLIGQNNGSPMSETLTPARQVDLDIVWSRPKRYVSVSFVQSPDSGRSSYIFSTSIHSSDLEDEAQSSSRSIPRPDASISGSLEDVFVEGMTLLTDQSESEKLKSDSNMSLCSFDHSFVTKISSVEKFSEPVDQSDERSFAKINRPIESSILAVNQSDGRISNALDQSDERQIVVSQSEERFSAIDLRENQSDGRISNALDQSDERQILVSQSEERLSAIGLREKTGIETHQLSKDHLTDCYKSLESFPIGQSGDGCSTCPDQSDSNTQFDLMCRNRDEKAGHTPIERTVYRRYVTVARYASFKPIIIETIDHNFIDSNPTPIDNLQSVDELLQVKEDKEGRKSFEEAVDAFDREFNNQESILNDVESEMITDDLYSVNGDGFLRNQNDEISQDCQENLIYLDKTLSDAVGDKTRSRVVDISSQDADSEAQRQGKLGQRLERSKRASICSISDEFDDPLIVQDPDYHPYQETATEKSPDYSFSSTDGQRRPLNRRSREKEYEEFEEEDDYMIFEDDSDHYSQADQGDHDLSESLGRNSKHCMCAQEIHISKGEESNALTPSDIEEFDDSEQERKGSQWYAAEEIPFIEDEIVASKIDSKRNVINKSLNDIIDSMTVESTQLQEQGSNDENNYSANRFVHEQSVHDRSDEKFPIDFKNESLSSDEENWIYEEISNEESDEEVLIESVNEMKIVPTKIDSKQRIFLNSIDDVGLLSSVKESNEDDYDQAVSQNDKFMEDPMAKDQLKGEILLEEKIARFSSSENEKDFIDLNVRDASDDAILIPVKDMSLNSEEVNLNPDHNAQEKSNEDSLVETEDTILSSEQLIRTRKMEDKSDDVILIDFASQDNQNFVFDQNCEVTSEKDALGSEDNMMYHDLDITAKSNGKELIESFTSEDSNFNSEGFLGRDAKLSLSHDATEQEDVRFLHEIVEPEISSNESQFHESYVTSILYDKNRICLELSDETERPTDMDNKCRSEFYINSENNLTGDGQSPYLPLKATQESENLLEISSNNATLQLSERRNIETELLLDSITFAKSSRGDFVGCDSQTQHLSSQNSCNITPELKGNRDSKFESSVAKSLDESEVLVGMLSFHESPNVFEIEPQSLNKTKGESLEIQDQLSTSASVSMADNNSQTENAEATETSDDDDEIFIDAAADFPEKQVDLSSNRTCGRNNTNQEITLSDFVDESYLCHNDKDAINAKGGKVVFVFTSKNIEAKDIASSHALTENAIMGSSSDSDNRSIYFTDEDLDEIRSENIEMDERLKKKLLNDSEEKILLNDGTKNQEIHVDLSATLMRKSLALDGVEKPSVCRELNENFEPELLNKVTEPSDISEGEERKLIGVKNLQAIHNETTAQLNNVEKEHLSGEEELCLSHKISPGANFKESRCIEDDDDHSSSESNMSREPFQRAVKEDWHFGESAESTETLHVHESDGNNPWDNGDRKKDEVRTFSLLCERPDVVTVRDDRFPDKDPDVVVGAQERRRGFMPDSDNGTSADVSAEAVAENGNRDKKDNEAAFITETAKSTKIVDCRNGDNEDGAQDSLERALDNTDGIFNQEEVTKLENNCSAQTDSNLESNSKLLLALNSAAQLRDGVSKTREILQQEESLNGETLDSETAGAVNEQSCAENLKTGFAETEAELKLAALDLMPRIDEDQCTEASSRRLNCAEYWIQCISGKRGDRSNAQHEIHISIIGTDGRTEWKQFQVSDSVRTEENPSVTLFMRDQSIGVVKYVVLFISTPGEWYLNYLVISLPQSNACHTMSCSQWLSVSNRLVILREAKGVLENTEVYKDLAMLRLRQKTERRNQMRWEERKKRPPPLPGSVSNPLFAFSMDMSSSEVDLLQTNWKRTLSHSNDGTVWQKMTKMLHSSNEDVFLEYEEIWKGMENHSDILESMMHWKKDKEFARKLLNVAPLNRITSLREIPDRFSFSGEMKKENNQENQINQFLLVSFSDLGDLLDEASSAVDGEEQEKYICGCEILLQLTQDPDFEWIPLAIRLNSDSTEGDERTITKKDDSGDLSLWLLAKLWLQVAATNSVILDDILVNHLLMEPVAVALERNLPSMHPLYKLLKPHLRGIPVINDVIRRHLLWFYDDHVPSRLLGVSGGDGERFWDYVSKKCQEVNLFTFDLELKLEMMRISAADDCRGIIPGCSLFDDLLRLWTIVRTFVHDILREFYEDDIDVASDTELVSLLIDLQDDGLPFMEIPKMFTTLDQLVQFSSVVIYLCTIHPAAAKLRLQMALSFSPLPLTSLSRPPVENQRPGGFTARQFKEFLPTEQSVRDLIRFIDLLSGKCCHENLVNLLSYPERHFTDDRSVQVIEQFQENLRLFSVEIRKEREISDVQLLPENINYCFTI